MKYIWRVIFTLLIIFVMYPITLFVGSISYLIWAMWELKLINYKEVFTKDTFYVTIHTYYHFNTKEKTYSQRYEVYKTPIDVFLKRISTVDSDYNDVKKEDLKSIIMMLKKRI